MNTMATDRMPAAKALRSASRTGGSSSALQHLALRGHPLVRLHDELVKLRGQDDLAIEQPWTVLVADSQRIAKPARDHEQRAIALALQQGIGRDRGAHLDLGHQPGGNRPDSTLKELADSVDGGIAVAPGILG